jgi:tRNA(Ile)-lysidine synthase
VKPNANKKVLRKARATFEKYSMAPAGSSVLVAVSGGADSVALLHVLAELRDELRLRISVAHLNHLLRGRDSDDDADFVARVAAGLGVPCDTETVDVRELAAREGRSLEDAGREARRRFLLRAASRTGCRAVATGHHADDQAETVLLRLIRGAGVRGLAGIEPVSPDGFVRPLIECRRRELRLYLDARGIPYREDSSNLDSSFTRNRIRHEVIPLLQRDFNPSIVRALARTSSAMAQAEGLLSTLADRAAREVMIGPTGGTMSLDSRGIRAYDKSTWRYVFQKAFRALVGDSQALSHAHLEALVELVEKRPTGTSIHLPGGIRARRGYGTVQIYRHAPRQEPTFAEREVLLPGLTSLPGLGGELETEILDRSALPPDLRNADPTVELFDAKDIHPPLTVRGRRPGDRIELFGSGRTKKLKDLLIDMKVPLESRDKLPIVADGRGILWVAGVRRSDRARITASTMQALCTRWLKR